MLTNMQMKTYNPTTPSTTRSAEPRIYCQLYRRICTLTQLVAPVSPARPFSSSLPLLVTRTDAYGKRKKGYKDEERREGG
ncbi:hypothetical protein E2C01_074979 [Portunus trituberculatus]|uniref:Uncharacterized protein n=1 Tax=Portunus trituberculatus TaxID=210409 RepID=A0A5B7I4V5_PORTR|nr:hypothetical protein [Portunus trituberculatus]